MRSFSSGAVATIAIAIRKSAPVALGSSKCGQCHVVSMRTSVVDVDWLVDWLICRRSSCGVAWRRWHAVCRSSASGFLVAGCTVTSRWNSSPRPHSTSARSHRSVFNWSLLAVTLCQSVSVCVCLSVKSRCSVEMDGPIELVFGVITVLSSRPKLLREFTRFI